MSLADELKKLEELRWNGTLTDEEFAQAKAVLLAALEEELEAPDAHANPKLAEHLAEVRYQNELTRIDREWEIEKEQYMITAKGGHRYIPTRGEGLVGAILVKALACSGRWGLVASWTRGRCGRTVRRHSSKHFFRCSGSRSPSLGFSTGFARTTKRSSTTKPSRPISTAGPP